MMDFGDPPHGPQLHALVHYEAVPGGAGDIGWELGGGGGGAVAKLLESDLTWASKYLRSDNLTPSSTNHRSSTWTTTNGSGGLCAEHENGRERSSCSGDEDDVTAMRPYRLRLGSSPRPATWTGYERRSLSRQRTPETPPTPECFFRSSQQPAESPSRAMPPRSYGGGQIPEFKTYSSVQIGNKPEMSATRKRLRKILCQSKNDPHYYD